MKKILKIFMVLVLTMTILLSASAVAERYDHNRTITKVTEEVVNGVMTGNIISVGTTSRAIGYAQCDIPSQSWYGSGRYSQARSYEVLSHTFSGSTISWRADSVYYTQLYVYLGSNDPYGPTTTIRNAYASGRY